MRADQVLIEHHNVLRALCKDITGRPAGSAEREERVDDLLVELDIHMRVEDDLFYPAVAAAGPLVAVAHAEHRQVSDRLAGFLRTTPTDPAYEGQWQAFVTTLDAHAEEEERDLFPPPVEMTADELDGLGTGCSRRWTRYGRPGPSSFASRPEGLCCARCELRQQVWEWCTCSLASWASSSLTCSGSCRMSTRPCWTT